MQLAWKIEEGSIVKLKDFDPDYIDEHTDPAIARAELELLGAELGGLQELLAAAQHHSLLVVLQGMDASGKADTIFQVLSQVNPQGCEVRAFKAPTLRELAHDFLWRVHRGAPGRGVIGIFNRSHYEDVLIVRVHNLVPEKAWSQYYEAINEFEELLAQNDTIIVKFFCILVTRSRKDVYSPVRRIKLTRGNSLLLIGLSVSTGTIIKQPTKMHSPSVVRTKLPGILCLRTRNGLAICSWHGPSLTPCVRIKINGWTS